MKIKPYLKGVYASLVVLGSGVAAAQPDISGTEWIAIAAAMVAADLGVFYVPYETTNKPPPG